MNIDIYSYKIVISHKKVLEMKRGRENGQVSKAEYELQEDEPSQAVSSIRDHVC